MLIKPPDLSETTWFGALLGIGGWVFGIAGVSAIFWPQPMMVLSFLAGASFVTAVALLAFNGVLRRTNARDAERIANLETDLAEARRQAGEWSATSKDIASATVSMISLIGDGPATAPVRVPRQSEPEKREDNDTR